MRLLAHSVNDSGVRHGLDDHLRGTAARSGEFGSVFGGGAAAGYLGVVHDVGKGACVWQSKLLAVEVAGGGRVGLDHKRAGALLAQRALPPTLARIVIGHHGGLPDTPTLKDELHAAAGAVEELEATIAAVAELVPEILPDVSPSLPTWLASVPKAELGLAYDLLIRMLFSCVVDADFLDTSAHFDSGAAALPPAPAVPELLRRFEQRRMEKLRARPRNDLSRLRDDVYARTVAAAVLPPGIHRLGVPTGAGKTFAAGGFGLHHAVKWGLRRVVVAVPFISITEQNSAVYRDLLERDGDAAPSLLEHHSAVDLDAAPRGAKLAAENWDSPFVVTTTVRLFESLFSRKPAAMRRLHRLAGAVIVLDEVQALPDPLLMPILSVLRGLCDHYGTTVLLTSATQPEFMAVSGFEGARAVDVIPDPAPLYARLRRVDYEWRLAPQPLLEDIAAEAADLPQALVVVNTTANAATVHRTLAEERPSDLGPALHLSTRMAPRHRRENLAEIGRLLAEGEPVAVVATPLVEAGVDVDFPVVYRAFAPAESLQQAAGRCNREGRLPAPGRVVVFDPCDGGRPNGEPYKQAMQATSENFGPGLADPDDLDALARYYRLRYGRLGDDGLGRRIQDLRARLDYPQVAAEFRMIDDQATSPVAVLMDDDEAQDIVRAAVRALRSPYPCGPQPLRDLQPYTASLPRSAARAAVRAGHAEPVVGDLLLWVSDYHSERGIDLEHPENSEDFTSW
ncbi:CRISPR-associated endonuclease Cas3'' [Embleya sp. NPDC020630]|uniref:CRISPR-associated endonuclease Cas3'' n=1 Tax=Embleya sp. NPDC020630 TaxID=3363979 RepID=UPI00378B0A2E